MPSPGETCSHCGETLVALVPNKVCPSCTLGWLAEGETDRPRVPGLTVHEEVGEGGFGIVYRATETDGDRREVALKCLKPGLDTRAILQRFAVEQHALAKLRHPHIAQFYAAGRTASGYPWFTMEYLAGPPIHLALRGRDWHHKGTCFLKVCEAITFAHEAGVLHRDLKPTNILTTPGGEPKVIDFGIARALAAEPGMTCYTADEITVGTPHYQAPEDKALMDERSDVFGLARTFVEVLTESPLEEREAPLRDTKGVPNDLVRILTKATAADPSARYPTVAAFSEDLQSVMAGKRIKVRRRTPWKRAVVMVVIVAALVVSMVWSGRSPDHRLEAREPGLDHVVKLFSSGAPYEVRVNAEATRALALFRENGRAILFEPRTGREISWVAGLPEGLGDGCFSEDGQRFLVTLSDGHFQWYSAADGSALSAKIDGTPRRPVWLNSIRHGTIAGETKPTVLISNTDHHLMAYTEEGALRWEVPLLREPYAKAVDPTHRIVVVGAGDGRLQWIDLQTQDQKVLEGHTSPAFRAVWSSDSQYFATASDDGTCRLWGAEGELQWIGRHGAVCRQVAFGTANKRVASVSWDGTARVWDTTTGELITTFSHDEPCTTLAFAPDGQHLLTGSTDGFLRVWDLHSEEMVAAFRCGAKVQHVTIVTTQVQNPIVIALTWEPAVEVIPWTRVYFPSK